MGVALDSAVEVVGRCNMFVHPAGQRIDPTRAWPACGGRPSPSSHHDLSRASCRVVQGFRAAVFVVRRVAGVVFAGACASGPSLSSSDAGVKGGCGRLVDVHPADLHNQQRPSAGAFLVVPVRSCRRGLTKHTHLTDTCTQRTRLQAEHTDARVRVQYEDRVRWT